eukprot:m.5128 g.5128  ORF g.5128 m.5128 type:complete len:107 (+) comp2339_c0_seq1:92-412(+)
MSKEEEEVVSLEAGNWPSDLELCLFHGIQQYRPIGVHRHVNMVMIYLMLRRLRPAITVEEIWEHLETIYDLESLNEMEEDVDENWTKALQAKELQSENIGDFLNEE